MVIFTIMSNSLLKVNAKSFILGLNEVPYLGYIITQDKIKPGPNKFQDIIYFRFPITSD